MATITEAQYLQEYTTAYEKIIGQSMTFLTDGQQTHLEKLFKLIDDKSAETTVVERLSMKKNAYISLMEKVTVASQQTAMELVDRKYKIEQEVRGMTADAEVKETKIVNEKIISGYTVDANGAWTGPIQANTSGQFQLEKLRTQQEVLEYQKTMTGYDTDYKLQQLTADLLNKAKTIESMDADIAFNVSKEEIMVMTRKDNIRIKAAEAFGEFMKYTSAAGNIASGEDYTNMKNLITAIGNGLANPEATAGTMIPNPVGEDSQPTK